MHVLLPAPGNPKRQSRTGSVNLARGSGCNNSARSTRQRSTTLSKKATCSAVGCWLPSRSFAHQSSTRDWVHFTYARNWCALALCLPRAGTFFFCLPQDCGIASMERQRVSKEAPDHSPSTFVQSAAVVRIASRI